MVAWWSEVNCLESSAQQRSRYEVLLQWIWLWRHAVFFSAGRKELHGHDDRKVLMNGAHNKSIPAVQIMNQPDIDKPKVFQEISARWTETLVYFHYQQATSMKTGL